MPAIDKTGMKVTTNFDTSWISGVTNPKSTVAPRKIKIASSFFRYFPRAINPCALIVYKKLEMNVTKIPVRTSALSSKSKSAITIGIKIRFLRMWGFSKKNNSVVNRFSRRAPRRVSFLPARTPAQGFPLRTKALPAAVSRSIPCYNSGRVFALPMIFGSIDDHRTGSFPSS
jgi:hypothetical protein